MWRVRRPSPGSATSTGTRSAFRGYACAHGIVRGRLWSQSATGSTCCTTIIVGGHGGTRTFSAVSKSKHYQSLRPAAIDAMTSCFRGWRRRHLPVGDARPLRTCASLCTMGSLCAAARPVDERNAEAGIQLALSSPLVEPESDRVRLARDRIPVQSPCTIHYHGHDIYNRAVLYRISKEQSGARRPQPGLHRHPPTLAFTVFGGRKCGACSGWCVCDACM